MQSQRVLRGYHPLQIIGEQQNKKVNIARDVFHRLYQGVLYSQYHIVSRNVCDYISHL
jgi:hypothetical protein